MDYSKLNGLVPAVIQDADSHEVLMVGFMNEEALARTRQSGFATFFSRTRNTVWMKGGCRSWYQDENGQTASMWPRTMWSYRRLLTRFVPADHHLRAVSPAAVPEPVA